MFLAVDLCLRVLFVRGEACAGVHACVERQGGFPDCIHSEKSLHQNKRDYGVSRVLCLLCLFT